MRQLNLPYNVLISKKLKCQLSREKFCIFELVLKEIHSWGSYVVFSKSLTPIEFQTWLVMKTCSITKRIVDFEAQHCALSFRPVILKLLTDSSPKRHDETQKFLKLYLNLQQSLSTTSNMECQLWIVNY